MPDGSVPTNLLMSPLSGDQLAPDWSQRAEADIGGDLVSLQAAARFAELAVEAAKQDALNQVQKSATSIIRDPADPLDQVAADWAAQVDADEQIIHAFLGIDDPIGREAVAVFKEDRVDAALEAFLDTLPDAVLKNGELAALSAFDRALASGYDAEEALSAAIQAAEQADASLSIGAAIAQSPPGIGLGLDTASLQKDPPPQGDDPEQPVSDPAPAPFISALPAGLLSAIASNLDEVNDATFGFGFQFRADPVEIFVPAENRAQPQRSVEQIQTPETGVFIAIVGTAATDLLVGESGRDALAGAESDDYVYADLPTNYNAALHDATNPLTNPTFAERGGDDVVSGGSGDDHLWGGPGNDRIHGDVPDPSSTLFSEFSFGLGATTGGDDTVYGGAGDDSLWGGDGVDIISGDAGDDFLSGDGGADQLFGGTGADNIFGYAGDDIIRGGEDRDTLSGGDGADDFQFTGGTGASIAERVQSLGTDTVTDYSAQDMDTLSLSNTDFGLGNSGMLTDGANYFEIADGTLSSNPFDISGGPSGSAILIMGSNSGTDGVGVYYTEDAAAATNLNSYQIADIISVNASDFEAADFLLKG